MVTDGVDEIRRKKMRDRTGRRYVLLGQQLANQTLVRPVSFRKVSGMGLMMDTCLAGNVRGERLVVVMKGRKKHGRQDNRQQEQR
jgi:hypothetical protein